MAHGKTLFRKGSVLGGWAVHSLLQEGDQTRLWLTVQREFHNIFSIVSGQSSFKSLQFSQWWKYGGILTAVGQNTMNIFFFLFFFFFYLLISGWSMSRLPDWHAFGWREKKQHGSVGRMCRLFVEKKKAWSQIRAFTRATFEETLEGAVGEMKTWHSNPFCVS